MMDLEQLDKRLSGVDPTLADAVRFAYIDTNIGLEDTRRTLSDRLQAGLTEGALGAFDQDSALSELRQQVNAQRSNEFAPPGVTDDVPMNPEGTAALPALIQELSVDETTGALKYKARRERHTMGSLTQRDTDADWTALAGLVASDSRLASGASEWQLARWNHAATQWQPFNLGADGTFLKSKGTGVAPEWTGTLPLSLHAWSHTSHHWDATANGGLGAWVASDDTIPLATVNHTGLVPALPTSNATNKFLNGLGNWRALSMADWHLGTANNYDMLRMLPVYGSVDPETGEPTIEGWDWQPFAPDMDDMSVWFSGNPAVDADDPWQLLIARPVSNGDTPETFTYQGETVSIADAILGMTATDTTPAWPKYLRQVSDGEGGFTLEWEDLCDQDSVPNNSLPYWYANGNEIRLKYLPKGTDGQILTSNTSGDPGWTTPTFAAGTHAATHKADGADSLADYFALIGHNHDGVYSAVGHTHPYVPVDYDYPLAEVLSWLTEAATAADDPWRMLVLKPVSNGGTPETWSYRTSTETIADAIMGMTVDTPATAGWPQYLRQVSDGEGGWNLEWEDLCDQDSVPNNAIPYWYVNGNEIRLKYLAKGTDKQVLTSNPDGDPGWAALPAATTSAAGVIQLEASGTTSKYLNGNGLWTTPPNTNTWPMHGIAGQVWTSQGELDPGHWADAPGTDWPDFAEDDFPQMLVGEMSTGEDPEPVYSWKTLIKQIVDGVGEATPVDKSIMLWDTATKKLKAFHATSAKSLLYWDGNNGLVAIGDATADKQVLRWNFDGETSVGPSWADATAAKHHWSHVAGDDLIPTIRSTYVSGEDSWIWDTPGLCPGADGTATKFLAADGTWKAVGAATQTVTLCSNVTYDLSTRQLRKFTRVLSFDAAGRLVSIGHESAASVIEQAVSMLGS